MPASEANSKLVVMKRVVVILICFSVFYAGVLWALEGCRDLGVGFGSQHDAENVLSSHHEDADTSSHHSGADHSKIHCPNVFGEFVLSSRVSLNADRSAAFHADFPGHQIHWQFSTLSSRGIGPPGPNRSPAFSRHLLLSVLRI
jgi:hypothetical protein